MRQTLAIMVDSYRDLSHRKLFWISIVLSLVVVLIFAGLGINEKGIVILWFEVPTFINSTIVSEALFYKTLFASFGVGTWLAVGAVGLAVVSTASIMPDFLASGTVELSLARPIARWRLFLTRYFAGLLFVVLQVTVFCVASMVVIGLRGKEWLPGILLAIPVVTLAFSFLYALSVLVGTLTRSTIAAVMAAAGLWFVGGMLSIADEFLLRAGIGNQIQYERAQKDVETRRVQLETETARAQRNEPGSKNEQELSELRDRLARGEREATDEKRDVDNIDRWHRLILSARLVLPKTGETLNLVERVLISTAEMEGFFESTRRDEGLESRGRRARFGPGESQIEIRAKRVLAERSLLWIIGTSLMFEFFCVGLATWIFSRRDY